ncbi:MAG: segregation/condensation protein A [Acutalibacteraceae bacterium]|nr:segregation/condensation protein A [Acutalibacteraceae bacterium]
MDLVFTSKDFSGPLDLLLHLISKNKLDIKDIEIFILIDQYISQIEQFREYDMDIASEFLDMASRLIYLKTVSLLPKSEEAEELKAELTGELIEYQLCKEMAAKLAENTEGFKTAVREPVKIDIDKSYKRQHTPDILLKYYADAVGRGLRRLPPPVDAFSGIVQKKIVSVSSKIVVVLRNLKKKSKVKFKSLFEKAETRSDVVATFLAVLELLKDKRIKADEKDGETIITMDKVG